MLANMIDHDNEAIYNILQLTDVPCITLHVSYFIVGLYFQLLTRGGGTGVLAQFDFIIKPTGIFFHTQWVIVA